MKNIVNLNLNNNEKMIIESDECPINKLLCCDMITIYLTYDNKNLILVREDAQMTLESLRHLLKLALKNEAQPHDSITQDIGFLWNERLQRKPGLVYKIFDRVNRWVGEDNMLWATPGLVGPKLVTWLYNNPQGDIILEITPSYPYRSNTTKEKSPLSYQDFMRDYKPLLIRTISTSTAKKWLEQAEDILNTIQENIQKAQKVN